MSHRFTRTGAMDAEIVRRCIESGDFDQGDDVSSHADTIRRNLAYLSEPGYQEWAEITEALDALLDENQRYEKALQRCATSRSKWVREVAEEALAGDAE